MRPAFFKSPSQSRLAASATGRPSTQDRADGGRFARAAGLFSLALISSLGLSACDLPAAEAEAAETLLGTKSGTISIPSSSPYDFVDVLNKSASKVRVPGNLTVPESASPKIGGPSPAVVILHSGIGPGASVFRYAAALQDRGVATLMLDSFAARGVVDPLRDQGAVPEQAMLADAFAALEVLRTDPRIDPDRIALMGFSKGGTATLYAASSNIAAWHAGATGPRFAAHIAFTPSCSAEMAERRLTGAPVLMLLGGADEVTPARDCVYLQRTTPQERGTLRYEVYTGAHHAFTHLGPVETHNVFNPAECKFSIDAAGVTYDARTGEKASTLNQRVTALSQCGRRGITMGGNAAARAQSLDDMLRFVDEVLAAP